MLGSESYWPLSSMTPLRLGISTPALFHSLVPKARRLRTRSKARLEAPYEAHFARVGVLQVPQSYETLADQKMVKAGGGIINQDIAKSSIPEQPKAKPEEVLVETPRLESRAKEIDQSYETFAA